MEGPSLKGNHEETQGRMLSKFITCDGFNNTGHVLMPQDGGDDLDGLPTMTRPYHISRLSSNLVGGLRKGGYLSSVSYSPKTTNLM